MGQLSKSLSRQQLDWWEQLRAAAVWVLGRTQMLVVAVEQQRHRVPLGFGRRAHKKRMVLAASAVLEPHECTS